MDTTVALVEAGKRVRKRATGAREDAGSSDDAEAGKCHLRESLLKVAERGVFFSTPGIGPRQA